MIAATICELLIAMAIGFYLSKRKVLNGEVTQSMSYLVMNFALPFLVIASTANAGNNDRATLIKFIIVGAALYVIWPFLGRLLTRVLRVKKNERGPYECFFVFANVMFMGFPVASALYGQIAVFYIMLFHLMYNIMYFTYGVNRLTHGQNVTREKSSIRVYLSNGTLASVAALILILLGVQLPDSVIMVCDFVGGITVPLSMVLIGASIGAYSLSNLFEDKRIFVVTGFRLVIMPILIFFVMTALGFDGTMRGVAVVSLGMPVGSMVAMGAAEDGVHDKLTSATVAFSTICSIITIPFLLTILSRI